MGNSLLTAAAIIRFIEQLEDDSLAFYDGLAERWPSLKDTFRSFAKNSQKNKALVVRTYQETVSDAYETSFSFEGVMLADTSAATGLAADAGLVEGIEKALLLEDNACSFYLDVAVQSESLLATIPAAFRRVARQRSRRRAKLEALLAEARSGV